MAALQAESLTIQEAAQYKGVHERTIRRYIESGALPATRLAGRKLIRVNRTDLDALDQPVTPARDESLERHIAQIVATAPPLTAEQRDRIAALLRPAANGGDAL